MPAMADSHNGVILSPGGYLQTVREALAHYHQRVIANSGEGIGESIKNASIIMVDQGRFPVHNLSRWTNGAAIAIANALVPQTDAEDGHFGAKIPDDIVGHTSISRCRGARGDYDALRVHPFHLLKDYLVITNYLDLFSQLTEVLEKVIGEAIIIID